jgi:hypothetical protein
VRFWAAKRTGPSNSKTHRPRESIKDQPNRKPADNHIGGLSGLRRFGVGCGAFCRAETHPTQRIAKYTQQNAANTKRIYSFMFL